MPQKTNSRAACESVSEAIPSVDFYLSSSVTHTSLGFSFLQNLTLAAHLFHIQYLSGWLFPCAKNQIHHPVNFNKVHYYSFLVYITGYEEKSIVNH